MGAALSKGGLVSGEAYEKLCPLWKSRGSTQTANCSGKSGLDVTHDQSTS